MWLNCKLKVGLPVIAAIIVFISYIDYRNDFVLSLFPLYLIPLVIIAWNEGITITIGMSLLAAILIITKDIVLRYKFHHAIDNYLDETIKVTLLTIISCGVWKIRQVLLEKDKINLQLKEALKEIGELREMIPICAWCHSIRNDEGFYEKIEVYLSQLTGAQLTHGICPTCMEKYYGDMNHQKARENAEPVSKK